MNPELPEVTSNSEDDDDDINEDQYLVREKCLNLQVENCADEDFLNSVSKNYKYASTEFKDLLKSIDYIAVTLIMRGPKDSKIITVTLSFIHHGKLIYQTLSPAEVAGKATSENIACTIKRVLQEKWDILDKVVCITTNNEPKLKKAVTECLEKPHKSCVVYTLSLVMQNSLEQIKSTYKFSKKSTNFKTTGPLGWLNTYYDMRHTCETSKNQQECQELRECVHILKYIKELTNILCSAPYLGLSSIIPLFDSLQVELDKCSPSTKPAKDLKQRIKDAIITRFGKYELGTSRFRLPNFGNALFFEQLMTEKSTFLDPRFKKAGFATMQDADAVQEHLFKDIRKLQYLDSDADNLVHAFEKKVKISDSDESGRDNEAGCSVPRKSVSEVDRLKTVSQNETECLWRTLDAKVEVMHYVQLPFLKRSDNPLRFWEENKQDYKNLYKLSLKYLCIPATLIYFEEILSDKVKKLSKYKNLKVEGQILFLNSYYSRGK